MLKHSPAPWHRNDLGEVVSGEQRDVVEGLEEYTVGIRNPADEALILKAPDLYACLSDLVVMIAPPTREEFASGVKTPRTTAVQMVERLERAKELLAEIERMAGE